MNLRFVLCILAITLNYMAFSQNKMSKKEMSSHIEILEAKALEDSLNSVEQQNQISELEAVVEAQNQQISKLRNDLRLAREMALNLNQTEDVIVQRLKIQIQEILLDHKFELDSIRDSWKDRMAQDRLLMDSIYKRKLSLFLAINEADSTTIEGTLSVFDSINTINPIQRDEDTISSEDSLSIDSTEIKIQPQRVRQIPISSYGIYHIDSVILLCEDSKQKYSPQIKTENLEFVKQIDYSDTLLRDTVLATNGNEKKWIASNKIVIEPGGFVRWLVKSTAIFEKKYEGEPFISGQDGANFCLNQDFSHYRPEDIEILQYSGNALNWVQGFPLCSASAGSPFCLEMRLNSSEASAEVDIYMKGAVVKLFYGK